MGPVPPSPLRRNKNIGLVYTEKGENTKCGLPADPGPIMDMLVGNLKTPWNIPPRFGTYAEERQGGRLAALADGADIMHITTIV